MLCSGEELGINDDFYPGADVDGLLVLDESAPVGEDIRKVVGLDDWIFDISVTANRPDCQSIFGIAREVAAVLKKPLKAPDCSYTEHKSKKNVYNRRGAGARSLPALYRALRGEHKGRDLARMDAAAAGAVGNPLHFPRRGHYQFCIARNRAAHARIRRRRYFGK